MDTNRKAEIVAACPHCAAGHKPRWQAHSHEWVHVKSPKDGKGGNQFSIVLCGANRIWRRAVKK